MNTNRFMLMFAPEGATVSETAITAPGVDVPIIEPATTDTKITEVEIHSALETSEPDTGIKGPKDLFGEDSEQVMRDMEEKMGKKDEPERDEQGKFVKKEKPEETKPKAKAAKKEPTKPVEEKPVEEAAPVKIKLNGEEKTQEEWEAHFKDLAEKAAKVVPETKEAKVEPAKPEPKKPEEIAAEREQEREKWLNEEAIPAYMPDQRELDTMLAGDPKTFAMFQAKVEERARLWAVDKLMPPLLEKIAELEARLNPLQEREKLIGQFTDENSAVESNPMLKSNPAKALELYRKFKGEFEQSFNDIQARAQANTASPEEQAWALIYGKHRQDPDQLRQALVSHVATELAKLTPPAPKNGTTSPAAKPPLRVTKPFNGDKPTSVSGTPKVESKDSQMIRDLQEAGKF